MANRIGNGLPSTLTAARIKAVLGLTKSQERALEEALETGASPAWTKTASSGDPFERLHVLLASVEGRRAYEEARSRFQGVENRQFVQTDLPARLLESRRKEVFGQLEKETAARRPSSQDLIERLVEDNTWASLAEVVWAESLISGDSGCLLGTIADHSEAGPYLAQVLAGLFEVEDDENAPPPEGEGEAAELTSSIQRIAEALEIDHLKSCDLLTLSRDALRLAEIAKARDTRDRDVPLQRNQVEEWEARHVETLAGAAMLENFLPTLRAQIDGGGMDRESVSDALDLAERLLSVDSRYQKTHEKLNRASSEEDFASVSSLAETLQSLRIERDGLRATIDNAFAEPQPDNRVLEDSSKEDHAESPDSETMGCKARAEELQPLDGETAPIAAAPSEDVSEPAARESSAPDDEGEDGESIAGRADGTARPDDDEDRSVRQVEGDIAVAISRGRFGLAYHLARTVPEAMPSATTIKLVVCNYVTDERAPVDAELPGIATALQSEAEDDQETEASHRSDHAILAACAALSPALVAPGGPVGQLLSVLETRLSDMPSLRAVVRTAAEVSMTGVHLPAALLREDDSLDKWRDRESALRNETTTWITNERQTTIKFQAATKVWRRILEDWERDGRSSLGHAIGLLNHPAVGNDVERVSRIVEYWRANSEREIDRIDRENRSRAATKKIVGSARLSLGSKVEQALTFCDRWLALIRERPSERSPFHTEQAAILRASVYDNAGQALDEIRAVAKPIAYCAEELFRRYTNSFKDTVVDIGGGTVGLTELLNGDLLADPEITFDDAGQPSEFPLNLDTLRKLIQQDPPDFGHAAVERARRGDFLYAEATLDFAERTGRIDDESADRAKNMLDEHRAQVQRNLSDRVEKTRDDLDAAYAEGTMTLETYEQLSAKIPHADFSEIRIYAQCFSVLDEIDREIDSAKANRRDAIRRTLDTLARLSPAERARIDSVVNAGRFQIAEDFIERIERDEELPSIETSSHRPFDRFFPYFVEQYSDFSSKEGDGILGVRRVIENRESLEFVDARELSDDTSDDGVALLDSWIALRNNPTSVRLLRPLAKAIGFEDVKVKGSNDKTIGEETIYSLETTPIADRSIAGLPDFGSRADGNYRLFTVRGRATGEAIIQEAGRRHAAGTPPSIVLFLGTLDADSRRALARDFDSGEYHPTIVLDEALVAFLAAWSGNRLAAFFDCASAFAFSQPFDPDATELPPEIFFGRTAARRAVLAMSGDMTHFVYGGRRLGKTTLLADIAREYRTRQQDDPVELVLLINMKGLGIGENQPTEDVWRLFADRLIEHRVLQPQTVRPDSIEKGIDSWLKEESGRRILLLVDEADSFLDAERCPKQGYRVLEQIKRLMERTQRRFKVVFAGLHNVQRAARDPNTPFAHMGEAIRIGPMLPEIDGDEIQNLIRSPLEALGYRFVSNDSIIRIAAETNYYPALAQQFCKELLKMMREDADTRAEATPPYLIYPEMVDRVFNARETRNRIRNLFSWTIQLDARYEFLTYLVAQRSFDNEDTRPQAVPIADIREAALDEWREGFASDTSFWMFEVLLEEMVGLGILRESSNKQYAIRTRNLRMLLGNDDEIARRFTDAKSRMAPPIFDPAQFRNTLSDETPSSLSADQENRLLSGRHAIGLVFGTRLAGLDRVHDSIERVARRQDGSPYVEFVAPATLRSVLRRVSRSRKPGIHVVLVDMRGAWDQAVFDDALTFVEEHDGQIRIIRPVFLCGPDEAWIRLSEPMMPHDRVDIREVWLGPCARDFARAWLTDRESPAYAGMENPGQPADLPWPATVAMAARNKQLESLDDAMNATLEDDRDNHHVADILISKDTKTVLRLLSTFSDESMTADVLSDLAKDEGASMSPEEILDFFGWADRLGVVCRDGHGYRLESAYAAGLGRIFGE